MRLAALALPVPRVLRRAGIGPGQHMALFQGQPRQFGILVRPRAEEDMGRRTAGLYGAAASRRWPRSRLRMPGICELRTSPGRILRLLRLESPFFPERLIFGEVEHSFPMHRPRTGRDIRLRPDGQSSSRAAHVQCGQGHSVGHGSRWPRTLARKFGNTIPFVPSSPSPTLPVRPVDLASVF